MAENKVYVGDIGTKILLDTGVDISSASERKIKYKKPDGTTGAWDATLEGVNKMYYLTLVDDLDQGGIWFFQAWVKLASGEWSGESVKVHIYAPFE